MFNVFAGNSFHVFEFAQPVGCINNLIWFDYAVCEIFVDELHEAIIFGSKQQSVYIEFSEIKNNLFHGFQVAPIKYKKIIGCDNYYVAQYPATPLQEGCALQIKHKTFKEILELSVD